MPRTLAKYVWIKNSISNSLAKFIAREGLEISKKKIFLRSEVELFLVLHEHTQQIRNGAEE